MNYITKKNLKNNLYSYTIKDESIPIKIDDLVSFDFTTYKILSIVNTKETYNDVVVNVLELICIISDLKLISSWEELSTIKPSKTHRLEIDVDMCCGWIIPLNPPDKKNYIEDYLSTHSFYEKNYKHSSALLQKCGFNIQLKNWG